jgi:hypothetical protein
VTGTPASMPTNTAASSCLKNGFFMFILIF